MITIIKLRDLFADLTKVGMAKVFADWEMLVGFTATAKPEALQISDDAQVAADRIHRKHLVIRAQVERGHRGIGSIYFAFPNALVVEIIADLLLIPESLRETKAEEGLTEQDLEAFQEMATLLCGSWNGVFNELGRDLRISQAPDDLKISAGEGGDGVLGTCVEDGRVAYVTLEVGCAGKTFTATLVLPLDVAIGIADECYRAAA